MNQCPYCNKKHNNIRTHIKENHKNKLIKCLECDKDFISELAWKKHITKEHNQQEYYLKFIGSKPKCIICGSISNRFINVVSGFKDTCKKQCAQIKTSRLKYGVDNPIQNKDVITKQKETIKSQSAEYKQSIIDKRNNTIIEKYGDANYRNSEKHLQTLKNRYGVDNAMQISDSVDKIKATKLARYGNENYNNSKKQMQTLSEKDNLFWSNRTSKQKATKLKRYGDENYVNLQKQKETIKSKYGVNSISEIPAIKEKRFKTFRTNNFNFFLSLLKNKHITFLSTKDEYIENINEFQYKCDRCGLIFSSDLSTAQHLYCNKCFKSPSSNKEKSLLNNIKEFYNDDIIENKMFKFGNKKYELDIYMPKLNLGIEFNGIYWHNSKHKDKNYHINKTNFFKDNFNIDVIHIFENEWDNKSDIVLSIIKNRMGLNENKIYARKTIKKDISSKQYKQFLQDNHIQGDINSAIKLGLIYNNEIVSVIGIGKSRFKKGELELHRFCNKKGYSIVGGFSKLLKGFNNLATYCDLSKFNGAGYKVVGFSELSVSKPNYSYTDGNIILSRMQCQKHKLSKLLPNFDENLTEEQNMNRNNYYRIYDCGNIKMGLRTTS